MRRKHGANPDSVITAAGAVVLLLLLIPLLLHSSCPQLEPEVHHGLGVGEGEAGMFLYPPSTKSKILAFFLCNFDVMI